MLPCSLLRFSSRKSCCASIADEPSSMLLSSVFDRVATDARFVETDNPSKIMRLIHILLTILLHDVACVKLFRMLNVTFQ